MKALLLAGGLAAAGAALALGPGDSAGGSTAPAASGLSFPPARSGGMRRVVEALKARSRALDRREQSIAQRESDLRQVEADLQQRLQELGEMRAKIEDLLAQADAAREARIRGLVKMVESMRPSQAAGVVTRLDDDLAVDVLGRMSGRKAGKLLAAMEPSRAAVLASALAEPSTAGLEPPP